MPNMYKVQDHGKDLLGRSLASHTMSWLGSMLFLVHTILVATSFYPSYFVTQEAIMAPKVSATRQVIQTNGLASGSSPITKARGV